MHAFLARHLTATKNSSLVPVLSKNPTIAVIIDYTDLSTICFLGGGLLLVGDAMVILSR